MGQPAIRIIGFLFENRLYWQLEVEKFSTTGCLRLPIYLRTNKILIHYTLYAYDNRGGGGKLNQKKGKKK